MFTLRAQRKSEMTRKSCEASGAWDGGFSTLMAPQATGLIAGTRVATTMGWRGVESLAVGDAVMTFDNGLQIVRGVARSFVWLEVQELPRALYPILIPAGAIGNSHDVRVLPEQPVMVESDSAEEVFGDPFALVPAAALEGFNGIERVIPRKPIEVVTLTFARDEVVFAEAGALFFCPAQAGDLWGAPEESSYTQLGLEQARLLVDCMSAETCAQCYVPAGTPDAAFIRAA
ncbi:hypothetical protein AQS8620_03154 [Aquimixticola soesokkakensis]|uniref:Hedgehog/Intein (Hint) domain-containing protein n=1 Tax=Aquimixticola soesokkakensis TaxID=1519096 RepID=A0A1Y5TQN7_9RHOB|nr:Hint domain-containing protein [Aquimixticola soesokkakensis]SLN67498.1 hypothetical protein AQS8620_03154 [Aquimixticola soesokkakensis]